MCYTDGVNTSTSSSSAKLCRRFALKCKDFQNYIFGRLIPSLIINLRYILVLLLLPMGILG
jgi:hypothetical protein